MTARHTETIRISRRNLLVLAATASATMSPLLAACTPPQQNDGIQPTSSGLPTAGSGVAPQSISWGMSGDPGRIDPGAGFGADLFKILSLIQEGLLKLSSRGEIEPSLAESWEQVDDVTYVFDLRPGVTFSDGSPLEPEDVIYTWEMRKDTGAGVYMPEIDKIAKTGPLQVTFTLAAPSAFFRYVAAIAPLYIMQRDFGKEAGDAIGSPEKLTVGTGPYRLVSYLPDSEVKLERNDAYWGGPVGTESITMRVMGDENAKALAMREGRIDGVSQFDLGQLAVYNSIDGVEVYSGPGTNTLWISLDQDEAPLDDVHVRRALSYSLDRTTLVREVLSSQGARGLTYPPPSTWGDLMSKEEVEVFYATLPQYEYDLDKARQELAQATTKAPLSATVHLGTSRELERVAEAWSQAAQQIGFELKVKTLEGDALYDRLYSRKGTLGINMDIWFADFPDPMNNFSYVLPSAAAAEGGDNFSSVRDDELDDLLERNLTSSDVAERADLSRQIVTRVADDASYLFAWWADDVYAVQTKRFLPIGLDGWPQYRNWTAEFQTPATQTG